MVYTTGRCVLHIVQNSCQWQKELNKRGKFVEKLWCSFVKTKLSSGKDCFLLSSLYLKFTSLPEKADIDHVVLSSGYE